MDEEALNMSIRKFLKNLGVNGQREIEQAVRDAVAAGTLADNGSVAVKATLTIEALGVTKEIDGEITLA